MHIIKPYQTSVTLFKRDGSVRVFSSLKKAVKALGYSWIANNVGKEFLEARKELLFLGDSHYQDDATRYVAYDYIMRDDAGSPVTKEDFYEFTPRYKKYAKWRWLKGLLAQWNGVGPVPGVHKPSNGHYYRRMATIRARRQAFPVLEEGEVAPRPSQNARNLPNSWDDHRVRSREINNWKRYRKTQWKS